VGTYSGVCPVHVGREAERERLAANAERRLMTLISGEAGRQVAPGAAQLRHTLAESTPDEAGPLAWQS